MKNKFIFKVFVGLLLVGVSYAQGNDMVVSPVWTWTFLVVLTLVLGFIGALIMEFIEVHDIKPLDKFKANSTLPVLYGIWTIVGLILFGWASYKYYDKLFPPLASKHGKELDIMMGITMIVTTIAFVGTQTALAYLLYKYRGKEGREAYYYYHNNKLEYTWTGVIFVTMLVLIGFGLYYWKRIMIDIPKKAPIEIEVVGQQFAWSIRYPGKDGKLGRYNFRLISPENPLGLDFEDEAAKDDIVITSPELHLPVNKQVVVHIRSKDVLHGFYAPHFRVNMYAVPGMPTKFKFTPVVTTEQMRKKIGRDDFNYELACGQLCGAGHYNMRAVILVQEENEFNEWLSKQKPAYASIKESKEQSLATTK